MFYSNSGISGKGKGPRAGTPAAFADWCTAYYPRFITEN